VNGGAGAAQGSPCSAGQAPFPACSLYCSERTSADVPEGEVVELVPLHEVLAKGGDYVDAEERERLHQSIDRGS
jgi:hypothetical protein